MSSQDGSEASSFDSEHHGDVARAGFSRMYVLLHSSLSPLDQSVDYRSEPVDDDAKAEDSRVSGERKRYEDLEGVFDEDDDRERFQLLYVNGGHYFHGVISLPDTFENDEAAIDQDEDDENDAEERRYSRMKDQRHRRHQEQIDVEDIGVEDLPLLLPHFQEQQDGLTCIDHISHFRQELRDVVYQMEEVGEFMVEELSKDKVIDRIEEGSREFHWMVSPQNPTFFELQTYRRTNESLFDAGVVIIVLKIVVRGVLLDVIYYKDSYFVTLRENAEELALEDTFIPNISCVGPCFVVRRYSDADIKQLLLWCSFPPDPRLSVRGTSPTRPHAREPLHLPTKILKVTPIRPKDASSILQANDSQLYCLFPTSNLRQQTTRKRHKNESHDDDKEQECQVVFQFTQYIYNGSALVKPSSLVDLEKLSSVLLPSLRVQAMQSLSFFGSLAEYADSTEWPVSVQLMDHVRRRFDPIALSLLDMVTESQSWIERFLTEIDEAARASASSEDRVAWLGSHLRGWLDNADGTEYFYELETSIEPSCLWGERPFEEREDLKSSDVALLLWKGIVNQTVVVVVYRRSSFFIALREVEDMKTMARDGLEFFGLLPTLEGKGRGYLVRSFPTQIARHSQQWLSGAKLLLWQTVGSVAREDLAAEDAQSKWLQSQSKWDEEKETSAWFETKDEDEKPLVREVDVRKAERADCDQMKRDTKAVTTQQTREKTGRHYHLAPLKSPQHRSHGAAPTAPWDIRTGHPL